MDKLKVGIIGCGHVARRRHIPAFLRLKSQVSLCAVCDLNSTLVEEAAREFSIKRVYTDFSEMLSKERLDIVDICTPPRTHPFLAIKAMENGCHVLTEKPMATNLSDCDSMIQASRKHNVKLSVVHNQRFYPPFLKAQKLLEEGTVGKLLGIRVLSLTPKSVYIVHESHWIHKLPGGPVSETGPHTIYMSLAFLKKVKDVSVKASKTLGYPWVLYDDYKICLEGSNADSIIRISHATDYRASEVDLICEEALIRLDLNSMLSTIYKQKTLKPVKLAFSSLDAAGQIIKGVISNTFSALTRKTFLGHNIMIEKFVNSIVNDQQVPVTPEEGRETARVMEMIVKKLSSKNEKSSGNWMFNEQTKND